MFRALIILSLAVLHFSYAESPQITPKAGESTPWRFIYPHEETKEPATPNETWTHKDRITNVIHPQLKAFFPKDWRASDKRTALLVFPGGGYSIESILKEGEDIAKMAADFGMIGIVVKYRIAQEFEQELTYPAALIDARRAMRVVRHHAVQYGIDPSRIGVIGFSAGGHLASMVATQWKRKFKEEEGDNYLPISPKPSFAMLIYPVISMQDDITHKGSRQKLLGTKITQEQKDNTSSDMQVKKDTCPLFFVHCKDDSAVPAENSTRMHRAAQEAGVLSELHLYEKGGHGFGRLIQGTDSDAWPKAASAFLSKYLLIPKPKKP